MLVEICQKNVSKSAPSTLKYTLKTIYNLCKLGMPLAARGGHESCSQPRTLVCQLDTRHSRCTVVCTLDTRHSRCTVDKQQIFSSPFGWQTSKSF